jgi:hypothetical protein
MPGLEQHQGVLHTIKAWLYPNYLQHGEAKYIIRVRTEKALSIAKVCAAATTRGGSDINYDTMLEAVNAYFDEAIYQLADGFSIETGYFSIHPKIHGGIDHPGSALDPVKNRVDFTFRKKKTLRDIIKRIIVAIQGLAETEAYIADITDIASGSVDETLTSQGVVVIQGFRIKIAGDNGGNGLYFVNTETGEAVKVTGNFVENNPSRLTAQLPALSPGTYHARIITQFSTSSTTRKEPRTIESAADLKVE